MAMQRRRRYPADIRRLDAMLDLIRQSLVAALLACATGLAAAQTPSPHEIRIPPWFVETLLDFREDVADAAKENKRLLVYFGQDGCPYCKQLMETTFVETRIAAKAKKNFVAIALNLWGDREVTWIDGKRMSEKELGRMLKVQFTPTVLMFDEKAQVIARLNGYYPAHRMDAALDYVAGRMETRLTLAEHLNTATQDAASATLNAQPFLLAPPHDLSALLKRSDGKPLLVLVERKACASCDELHREGFRRPEVAALVKRFNVVQLDAAAATPLTAPDGTRTDARSWARQLALPYAPSLVFFDGARGEVFRVEGYTRPFHLAAALDYVASRAYREQPSFQRFIQTRAEHMRERGQAVELWK
jgi:thioredoxin-related protein